MFTGDVSCVKVCSGGLRDVMYAAEDNVGLRVPAGALPPAFDDSCVVTVAFKVEIWAIDDDQGADEKFEGDSLCPADVTAL